MTKRYRTEFGEQIELFHEKGLYIPTKTIYFGSEYYGEDGNDSGVDFASVEKFIKNLHILSNATNDNDEITIYMNSPGGEWYHGIGIYDMIRGIKNKTKIIAMGNCFSMATIIMQAGNVRLITENTKMMIHDGYDGFNGIPKSFQAWAKDSESTLNKMYQIYYQKMRIKKKDISLKEIEEMCSHDYIMGAEKVVKFNLADRIIRVFPTL